MSEAYVNQHGVLVVKVGRGESTFYLLDVEARKRAADYASSLRLDFPELASNILTILMNSLEGVERVRLAV